MTTKKAVKPIGQNHLIKELDLIFKAFKGSDGEIKVHFMITGPSGNGKTETINYLCEKYDLPLVETNAAGLTKEGLSGNSVSKALSPIKMHANVPVVVFVDEHSSLLL